MNKFTFGMYKGKDIDVIISINPKYVLWAEENVSYFSLSQEQHNTCIKNIKDMYRPYKDTLELRERTWGDYDDIDGCKLTIKFHKEFPDGDNKQYEQYMLSNGRIKI